MKKYDVIIIGAGPAGLTAAIYCARYKLDTIIIGKTAGGLAGGSYEVCNFPSHKKIKGIELMAKIIAHVKELGVKINQEEVKEINKNKEFEITTDKEKYSARKIIIATGSERRKLELKKEKEFTGKGVSYCATCDAAFYKDKVVGVLGGSDAALTSALLLTKFAKKVYIIYRKEKFCRAEPIWIEEVLENKKIKPIFDSTISELIGEKKLEGVKLNDGKELELDGLFIEIGNIPNTYLAEKLGVKLDCENIIVDKKQKTNVEGVFAAGDVTNNPLKQIITACGEGAVAANTIYKELTHDTSMPQ